jgi:hypothetical protein
METQKNKAPSFSAMLAAMLSGQYKPSTMARKAIPSRPQKLPHQGERECARRVRQMAAGKYDMAQVVRHG